MQITDSEKERLLKLSRKAIITHLTGGKIEAISELYNVHDNEIDFSGVFVSVYIAGELRGCIGTFSGLAPLDEEICRLAVEAATHDSRFKPVSFEETEQLTTEISILTPREQVRGPEDIIVGKHGIYLVKGYRKGTLLPQVAMKNNWNAIEFLECCAHNKMGLPKNGWKGADIYVYQAEVFKDE